MLYLLFIPFLLCASEPEAFREDYFKLGMEYERKNEGGKALVEYLKGLKASPERVEPYYFLAHYYRGIGEYGLSVYFAKQGKELPLPDEASFLSEEVYEYLLDEELSISGYYTPYKDEGFAATNRLIVKKQVPDHVKYLALDNALHYAKPLPANFISVDIEPPKISETESYHPMNPSIQKTKTGYDIICRTVNFGQKDAKEYWSRDPNNSKIDTRNFLLKTDKKFKTLSQEEIKEKGSYQRFPYWYLEGSEDCRLFSFRGENWYTCSVYDANPSNRVQIALGNVETNSLIPLMGPDKDRVEKNWLPFALKNEMHVVYSHEPFTLYKPDPLTGACEKVLETTSDFDCSSFRGSAGPVPFDEGYLTLVHEVAYPGRRYYLHRFVYLDKNFKITKLSAPFYFKTIGIEYVSGMTMDHKEENMVITLGLEDREALIAIVPLEEVRNRLVTQF